MAFGTLLACIPSRLWRRPIDPVSAPVADLRNPGGPGPAGDPTAPGPRTPVGAPAGSDAADGSGGPGGSDGSGEPAVVGT